MRTSERNRIVACLVLAVMSAACSPASDARRQGEQMPCGHGAGPLTGRCTVERSVSDRGPVLTLYASDGGFRRLLVVRDGRGVVAADGAEPALVTPNGDGTIEVQVGRDRYRLPATTTAER